jgi:hypothetical protein
MIVLLFGWQQKNSVACGWFSIIWLFDGLAFFIIFDDKRRQSSG